MNVYLVLILVFLISAWLLDLLENVLNVRHLSAELPDEFRDVYDADRYRRSQNYLRESTRGDLIATTTHTVLTIAFLVAGGFGFVDRLARACASGPIAGGLVFAGLLALLSGLVHLPFAIHRTFALEARYGFNRTSWRTFTLDLLKTVLLGVAIGGPVLAAVLWFFQAAGPAAWFYAWVAVSLIQILLVFAAPVLIMPLFNTFTPLADGELKTALETYAHGQGFRMRGIFTMDGSKRSTKSNAFFTGFGRYRRIVLFDTLVRQHTVAELVAVLAHEMGHYKRSHVARQLGISFLTTGMGFALLAVFIGNPAVTAALGIARHSLYAGLIAFGFLAAPLFTVLSVCAHLISRRHEYAADRYAAETCGRPDALIAALKKLSVDNLSNLTPHPFKVFMDYSHPPVLARIRALRARAGADAARARSGPP